MGQSCEKLLGPAGWMPGNPVLHGKVDPPLGNECFVIIFRTVRSHRSAQLLKERIINSLSRVSQASRTHLTISGRGRPRIFPAAVNEWAPSAIHTLYFSVTLALKGLFHATSGAWIYLVQPSGTRVDLCICEFLLDAVCDVAFKSPKPTSNE